MRSRKIAVVLCVLFTSAFLPVKAKAAANLPLKEVHSMLQPPKHKFQPFVIGLASWYGPGQQGHLTATGEKFDMHISSAASPTLPLPCLARVTVIKTGKQMLVRVNDRGPAKWTGRVLDLSKKAASELGVLADGLSRVQVEYLGPANYSKRMNFVQ